MKWYFAALTGFMILSGIGGWGYLLTVTVLIALFGDE